jgi:uncharacterized protein YfaA (DUF2138 family)
VYVREAHANDGAFSPANKNAGIDIRQPRTFIERSSVAKTCATRLQITMPVLVDTIDDRVGHAYSGMPDRLYVIDRNGKVAYQGGRGPFGFKPSEMEQSLALVLLEQLSNSKGKAGSK